MKRCDIKCSEFVKRQTKDSGYSHFDGTWEELETIVFDTMVKDKLFSQNNYSYVRVGYKLGVLLVDLHLNSSNNDLISKFHCSIVSINKDTELNVSWAPRKPGERSFIRVSANGWKQRANKVTIVLYHQSVLDEDKDRSTNAEWEIIAIKARVSSEEEPMEPYTMARNFLHLDGGTKGTFTAEEFANSIVYWNDHCMLKGKMSFWTKVKRVFK